MFRRERWSNRLLVALAAWLFVPCANAQQFSLPMTLGESLKPDYYRRDLSALGEELRLDDEQRVVIDSLFSDFVIDSLISKQKPFSNSTFYLISRFLIRELVGCDD